MPETLSFEEAAPVQTLSFEDAAPKETLSFEDAHPDNLVQSPLIEPPKFGANSLDIPSTFGPSITDRLPQPAVSKQTAPELIPGTQTPVPETLTSEKIAEGEARAAQELHVSHVGISPEKIMTGKEISKATGLPEAVSTPISAVGKLAAGIGQYATSKQGLSETALAATPVGVAVLAKWAYDMVHGGVMSAIDIKDALTQKVNDYVNTSMANAAGGNVQMPDRAMAQRVTEDVVNSAAMLAGGAKAGTHAISTLKFLKGGELPNEIKEKGQKGLQVVSTGAGIEPPAPISPDLVELAPATALEVAKTTEVSNAIREPSPREGVLRPESPQPEVKVELQRVGAPPEQANAAPLSIGGGANEVRNQTGAQELADQANLTFAGETPVQVPGMVGTWDFRLKEPGQEAFSVVVPIGSSLETIVDAKNRKIAQLKEVAPTPAPETPPVAEQSAPVSPTATPKTPTTMRGRSTAFNEILKERGVEQGWVDERFVENQFDPYVGIKTGRGPQSAEIDARAQELWQQTYREVATSLGLDKSALESESARAQTLEKLQDYLKKQDEENARMDAVERGDEGAVDFTGMGGAVPSEFNKPGDYVSNMFAAIDRDRRAMGKEPMAPGTRRTWDEDNQKALAKMNRDPGWIQGLLREVAANPRPLLSWENAGLVWERARLTAEAHNAMERVNRAFEDGRLEDRDAAQADMVRFENDIMQLDAAVGRGGTGSEAGRSLQAQKMATGEDFTLVEMRLQKRASANDGAPLTPAQETEVAQLHQKIAESTKAYEDLLKKNQALESERALAESISKIQAEAKKSPTYDPRVIKSAQEFVSELDKEASGLMADFRKRYGGSEIQSMGAAIFGEFDKPPRLVEKDLNDIAVYGASQIAKGLGDRVAWDKHMLEGSKWIQPYLDAIWLRSNKLLEARLAKQFGRKASKVAETITKEPTRKEKATLEDKIRDKFEKADKEHKEPDVTGLIQKLARQFVEEGVRDRDELIKSVHEVISEIRPDWTERDTMDAISGYGKFKQLTKDEISVKLRDLKGQMQQVAKLEDMQASTPPSKTGVERRKPSDEERRLIRLVNQWKNEFQIPSTDPSTQLQSSLDTLKARLKHQIADYETKLENKDYSQRPGRRMIQRDAEANQLHYEMTKAKEAWHRAMMQDRLAKASKFMKTLRFGGEVLNTQRAILTSADFSAVLRQGGFIALGHPIRAAKSFPAMFRAFRSEAGQHAVMEEIKKRDNYPQYLRSKLYLSEHQQKLSQMEEAYMSRWAEKIPLVAGSQRAYTTFLNKLRADSFDEMEKTLSRKGEFTPKEADAVANYINVSTGRGKFGVKNDAALAGMATMFFAPRYVASRFQLLAGQPLYQGTARTRVMVAKEYARFMAGIAVVYGLAKLDGATVEEDPRSSDFGKLRYGNTRLDPMAGLLQSTVLLAREGFGETKQLKTGNIVPLRGDKVKFGGSTGVSVLGRFARTKLAPAPGVVMDMLAGTDINDNPITLESELQKMTVPLSLQDILKAMDEQGIPRGTAISLLSMFGMGLQNFDVNQKR